MVQNLVVFGGVGDNFVADDTFRYDISKCCWSVGDPSVVVVYALLHSQYYPFVH